MNIKINKRTKKRKYIFNHKKPVFTWLILGVFVITTVFFMIQGAAHGATLANVEQQEAELTQSNQGLSRQLVEATSLSKIEQSAEELGFLKLLNTLYIQKDETVAVLP